MRVTIWYFANPNSARVHLEGLSDMLAGADVIFHRSDQKPMPDFVRLLFQIDGVNRVSLSGTANDVSLGKDPTCTWQQLLPSALLLLRSFFDSNGRIMLSGPPSICDRSLLPGDLRELPNRYPFGETKPTHRQLTLFVLAPAT